jgi:toxin FitB
VRYLLDTNVLSEAARPEPDPGVVDWLDRRPILDLAISVLTLGEIRKGVDLMEGGRRRRRLRDWLETSLPEQFEGRVLPIDRATALEWGRLTARGRRDGRELHVVDGLLLATAAAHRLVLVTRNERDCRDRGVEILNPWTA